MKFLGPLFVLACLLSLAAAVIQPIECPGAPSASCSASSFLQITVSRGSCSGVSSANCKTWSESTTEFTEAIAEWISDPAKLCDKGAVEATAEAVATAVAQVWTSGFVDVTCSEDSQGFACGWTFSNGRAFAASIAEAIAQSVAEASVELGTSSVDAFCFSDIRAIGGAFAEASAQAAAATCTTKGNVVDWQESFASATQTIVARALASASASSCGASGDFEGSSKCKGTAEVEQFGSTDGSGDFCGGVAELARCDGAGAQTCCGRPSNINVCLISRSQCPGCNGPWTRVGDGDIWQDEAGKQCFCA